MTQILATVGVVLMAVFPASVSLPTAGVVTCLLQVVAVGLLFISGRRFAVSAIRGTTETCDATLDEAGRVQQREQELKQREQAFETAREEISAELNAQAERLKQRSANLTARFVRFHEFMEYPGHDESDDLTISPPDHARLIDLAEKDRQVHAILEAEAERVYEKLRANGYATNGRVDLPVIRDEVLALAERVARVYSPDSPNPLLETSIEKLARAAGRVCLHSLVLIEQLPLSLHQ
ncbi:MAG: DUF4200 domain-containing protein, partial [Planctomycetaceae bacterium]|nr:DUF4200 domain-containing protein [Planctomycetaceae bacterium]